MRQRAPFGAEGSHTKDFFCGERKNEGMVCLNIVKRRCGHPSCNKWPIFGAAGTKTREFCGQHKKEGMVDLRRWSQSRQKKIKVQRQISCPRRQ